MGTNTLRFMALLSALTVTACTQPPPAPPTPTVLAAMKDIVAPKAQALWDVSNKAVNDEGDPDASKLTAQEWDQLVAAGGELKAVALKLATEPKVKVADPGVKIQDEGPPEASTAAQVQGFIDKNPTQFSEHARKLADTADAFVLAASAKDAVKLMDASGNLDGACEACHVQFWYPQQAQAQ